MRGTRIGTISSQISLAAVVGTGGVRREIKKRRRTARKEFRITKGRISKAREDLGLFRGTIQEREAEIVGVESEIASATRIQERQQRTADAFRAARKAFLSPSTAGIFALSTREEREFFRQFEAGSQVLQPTQTEIELQISLPTGLRDLPSTEIVSGLPGFQIFAGQSIAPVDIKFDFSGGFVGRVQELGGVFVKRTEFEQIRQQSLPLGTAGRISQKDVREFTFGEFLVTPIQPITKAREKLFGVGLETARGEGLGIGLIGVSDIFPKVKREKIIVEQKTLGLGIRGVSTLIPTTPLGIGITGGLVLASVFAPPIVAVGIGAGVTGFGLKGALDPSLTIEERVGSGIVVGIGAFGFAAGSTPFIRGLGAKGTKTSPRGFEVITDIKSIGDIGLIQPGKGARSFIDLPKGSPLVKGGFGVKQFEKGQFLGKDQFLATSQRGLFEIGKDIKIEKEFFVTPQEPTLKISETRISRLGLTDLFKFPKDFEIGFGLPPTPQIGITIGEVARTQRKGAFAIGRGSELEAIKSTGFISGVEKIGRVRIKSQGVDIFKFDTTPGLGTIKGFSRKDFITTGRTTRVSGETTLSILFGGTRGFGFSTRPSLTFKSPFFSRRISPPSTFKTPPPKPPPSTPPPSKRRDISLPPSTLNLPSLTLPTFKGFFPTPTPPKRIAGKRKPKKIKRERSFGFQFQLAPSFTAIVGDLRGVFPTELRVGGISPKQIRVLPRRRVRTKKR